MFSEALWLKQSGGKGQGKCTQAQYFNDSNQLNQPDKNYYDQFWNCVQEIMIDPQTLNFVQIDATHRFSTASPKDQPGASDIFQALQVNKKWVQIHDKAVLVDSIKI